MKYIPFYVMLLECRLIDTGHLNLFSRNSEKEGDFFIYFWVSVSGMLWNVQSSGLSVWRANIHGYRYAISCGTLIVKREYAHAALSSGRTSRFVRSNPPSCCSPDIIPFVSRPASGLTLIIDYTVNVLTDDWFLDPADDNRSDFWRANIYKESGRNHESAFIGNSGLG